MQQRPISIIFTSNLVINIYFAILVSPYIFAFVYTRYSTINMSSVVQFVEIEIRVSTM